MPKTAFQIKRRISSFFLTLSVLSFTLALTLLFAFFAGCSGAAGSNASSANNASSTNASSSSDGAAYSAVIDGKAFSGMATNGVSKISLDENTTMDGLNFSLGYQNQKQGFEFVINNSGTTQLRKDKIKTVCNYRTADGALYIVDSATVTLNSGSGSRTTGTFSGRWVNAHYGNTPATAPETIQITDGKFDLP